MSDLARMVTRIGIMRRGLLALSALQDMARLPHLGTVIDALLDTGYKADLAEALAAARGLDAVDAGLLAHLARTVDEILALSAPRMRDEIWLLLEAWDVEAVKAILRGRHGGAPADEILQATGPTVRLRPAHLEVLVRQEGVRQVVETLCSQALPWGDVLLPFMKDYEREGRVAVLEEALERRRYGVLEGLDESSAGRSVTLELLSMEAEIANIRRCLAYLGRDDEVPLLPQGTRSPRWVRKLAGAHDADEVIRILAGSPFAATVDQAALHMSLTGRVYLFERLLDRDLLAHARRWALRDPLGIACPYYFLRCKRNEVQNLRLVAHCIDRGIAPSMTMSELILPRAA